MWLYELNPSLTISIGLVLLIFFILYKCATKDFNYWKKRGVFYRKPTPFFGNLTNVVTFKKSIGHALADIYFQTKEPAIGIWCFNMPYLLLRDPKLISQILSTDFVHFNVRAIYADESVDPIAGNSLYTMRYQNWRHIRPKMAPIFSSLKMKTMMPLLQRVVGIMLNHLEDVTDVDIDIKKVFEKFTIDGIISCVFGVEVNSYKDKNSPFVKAGKKIFEGTLMNAIRFIMYFLWPNVVSLVRVKLIQSDVAKFLKKCFSDAVATRRNSQVKRNDMIDLFIKLQDENQKEGVDDIILISQAINFFLAGFETTSSIMAFFLYELSLNEEVQDKLRSEIKSTLSKNGGNLTYEALSQLRYFDNVLSETLRKYPVLPFLERRCVKEYHMSDSDVVIEEGTPVLIPLFGIHYDPEIYPSPDKFDPDRFSAENVDRIPNYGYLPFGAGPRMCIGAKFANINIKLALTEILSRYEVRRAKGTPDRLVYDVKSLTLAILGGIHVRLVRDNDFIPSSETLERNL